MLLFCMHAPQLRCTTIFVRTDYKHDSIAARLTEVRFCNVGATNPVMHVQHIEGSGVEAAAFKIMT